VTVARSVLHPEDLTRMRPALSASLLLLGEVPSVDLPEDFDVKDVCGHWRVGSRRITRCIAVRSQAERGK
jgi:hypothetical protein